ncbi:endonuclease/exonuclease/phosphatase family protein [Vibrio brasiliensis]|uniref:endonuclease/exonuclease/phosphatase family protein n=1 Tax=Vibrio brasiliensis TaxID=170652 RepID=UPI001EFCEE4C|nr:endonuclease/exonuclease/phosphatase family protein [Vibrio brasiliensis]MCG9780976.1 endonuclease/exonuclease/phosphatase family protein [Vibrio brasiliensis]
MKKIRLLALPLLIAGVVFAGYQTVFSLPQQAQISSYNSGEEQLALQCYNNEQAAVLDEDNRINLLVWNIYKQNRDTWRSRLDQYAQGKQLVLLQEASMTPQLKEWISKGQWFGSQVDAFKAFDTTAGVLNLSPDSPSKACAYTELEPWLRLPKSALYALYPLSNGQHLAVVNIHAVNFTYGTEEYHRQLKVLVDELSQHQGPVIVAGDFNSWSEQRLKVMSESLSAVGLKEVNYTSDNRTQFITGLPLDHVFYRGLKLEKAEAPISDASDHNPILVTFHL